MQCPECGTGVNKGWEFCPKCGESLASDQNAFSDVFDMLAQQMAEVNKMIESQVEAVDLSPWFKKGKGLQGRGFAIKITSGGNREPQISVETFGDVERKDIERQLYNQLGVQKQQTKPLEIQNAKTIKSTPKTTEEPKTSIKSAQNKLFVDIELPKAKASDIEIKELPSSVEVKAIVGDKAFFKILTKPENKRISNKSFEKGALHLEFS